MLTIRNLPRGFPSVSLTLAALTAIHAPVRAAPQSTTRESVVTGGAQSNGDSYAGRITPDGRYVVFESVATNLVTGDTNGSLDVFVRDRQAGTTTRASVDATGTQGSGVSGMESISDDGRYVCFYSDSATLVAGDTNTSPDIFVKDRQTGTVVRANLSTGGAQTIQFSDAPFISGNGRYVTFASFDTGLVTPDTNGKEDVFLRDLQTNTTTRVSVDNSGAQCNADALPSGISADGRYVLFYSSATNLVTGDTNATTDLFLRDTQTNTTIRVNVDSSGVQANGPAGDGELSRDGQFVAFFSNATNLVTGDTNGLFDAFVRDLVTGVTKLVSTDSGGLQGNALSENPALSYDGRFVVWSSAASNFVAGDSNTFDDVFLKDRLTAATTRQSLTSAGAQANFGGAGPSISRDGRYVCFVSGSTNLVTGDTNNFQDVFVRDRGAPTPIVYCTAKVNSLGCTPAIGFSGVPSVSSASPFNVTATQILNQRNGLLFYGYYFNDAPYVGGLLCLRGALKRTPIQNAGGNLFPTNDCSGAYSFNFNGQIQSLIDPGLVIGASVYCQYFYRDPASVGTLGLSNALQFFVGP